MEHDESKYLLSRTDEFTHRERALTLNFMEAMDNENSAVGRAVKYASTTVSRMDPQVSLDSKNKCLCSPMALSLTNFGCSRQRRRI